MLKWNGFYSFMFCPSPKFFCYNSAFVTFVQHDFSVGLLPLCFNKPIFPLSVFCFCANSCSSKWVYMVKNLHSCFFDWIYHKANLWFPSCHSSIVLTTFAWCTGNAFISPWKPVSIRMPFDSAIVWGVFFNFFFCCCWFCLFFSIHSRRWQCLQFSDFSIRNCYS